MTIRSRAANDFRCDRCGAEEHILEGDARERVWGHFNCNRAGQPMAAIIDFYAGHLCPACVAGLQAWWKQGKESP